jgi:hypothetical protein
MYSMRQNTVGYAYPTSSSYYQHKAAVSYPSRQVNPALTVQGASRSAAPFYGSGFHPRSPRAEIDDAPIIDPRAFQFLNGADRRTKKKPTHDGLESGIDTRPIINLDAVAQLERRRQHQIAKNNRLRGDDGSSAGIDDRSIVDANAFRYLENRRQVKQGQVESGGIDDRPITNPDAFK